MHTSPVDLDALVIGAGIVGLAVGRALALQGQQVAVIDPEGQIASQTSARNSGVIHAGFYYPPGSLKATHCARGSRLLRHYCQARQVPLHVCGKLVLATDQADEERLLALKQRGEQNGVEGLSLMSPAEVRRHGDGIRCQAALRSAQTAIVDGHALAAALASDLTAAGGVLALRTRFVAADSHGQLWQAKLMDGDGTHHIRCHALINCAGLAASRVAQCIQGVSSAEPLPQTRYARGNYFSYHGPAPADTLLYPLPEANGLGIHLTLDLAGQARFGPDVEWVDIPSSAANAARLPTFIDAIHAYLPDLDPRRLSPAWAGVRPKAFIHGEPANDFVIWHSQGSGSPALVQLFGIESPGLTCALSLAETVTTHIVG